MRYLQNVIAWMEDEKYREELFRLSCTLQKEGIRFQYARKDTGTDSAQKTARLWITDCSDLAVALQKEGEAVLAVLHEGEGGSGQNFSGVLYACEHPGELDGDYMEKVYRRYAGLPWYIAETERCLIRETTESDVEAFFEIYSNPEITKYTEKLYPAIEQEKQYVREYIEKIYGFYGFGVWTVLKKDTGEVIGRVGFSYREGFEEPEIGFVIGIPWQRQGYAEEVCRTLLSYGEEELGFPCVQAFVMPDNIASVHLCEKLGLHKVGSESIAGTLYDRFLKKF